MTEKGKRYVKVTIDPQELVNVNTIDNRMKSKG
jgi:hypothetical protein